MTNWGYNISQPRTINLDKNDRMMADIIQEKMPELETCIACGSCTATCSAGNLTDFNIRQVHTLVRRGEYQGMYEMLKKCMFCGKCRLSCPRGINTRGLILLIKKELGDY